MTPQARVYGVGSLGGLANEVISIGVGHHSPRRIIDATPGVRSDESASGALKVPFIGGRGDAGVSRFCVSRRWFRLLGACHDGPPWVIARLLGIQHGP
jgi:hypothetical protein